MTPDQIRAVGDLLSPFLWPAVTAWGIWLLRGPLDALIRRIVRGKFAGGEFEAVPEVAELVRTVEELGPTLLQGDATPSEDSPGLNGIGVETARQAAAVDAVLQEAATNPVLGLIKLSVELEREVDDLMLASGWVGRLRGPRTVHTSIEELKRIGFLAPNVAASLDLFRQVRNKVVHGGDVGPNEVLRAVDSGIRLLRAVQAIPRQRNRVKYASIPIFSDADCSTLRPGVTAVVLESESAGMMERHERIFPAGRDNFQVGEYVAWDWNLENPVGESWYKDPETGKPTYAWTNAGFLVGTKLALQTQRPGHAS